MVPRPHQPHIDAMTEKTIPTETTTPVTPITRDAAEGTKTDAAATPPAATGPEQKPGEIGGPKGPEPTRYGDWEFKGRCSDF